MCGLGRGLLLVQPQLGRSFGSLACALRPRVRSPRHLFEPEPPGVACVRLLQPNRPLVQLTTPYHDAIFLPPGQKANPPGPPTESTIRDTRTIERFCDDTDEIRRVRNGTRPVTARARGARVRAAQPGVAEA